MNAEPPNSNFGHAQVEDEGPSEVALDAPHRGLCQLLHRQQLLPHRTHRTGRTSKYESQKKASKFECSIMIPNGLPKFIPRT